MPPRKAALLSLELPQAAGDTALGSTSAEAGEPTSSVSPQEQAQVKRFKYLTEVTLPALAREHHWPLRLDHCFKRICLDFAFQDVWYKHLEKPAERHLYGEALTRSLGCAEELAAADLALLKQRNCESLAYRGKLKSPLRAKKQECCEPRHLHEDKPSTA